MGFTLIVATVGRSAEIRRLFDSLRLQTYKDFQVVVVDQNEDDRVSGIIKEYPDVPITRLTSPRGLSRARNVALSSNLSDVVGFPDDDCWYEAGFLDALNREFKARQVDGITTRATDEAGSPCGVPVWDEEGGALTPLNVWKRGISFTLFLKRDLIASVGFFDEGLGAGSGTRFGAGEETDYLLKALAGGAVIEYLPQLVVHHPATKSGASPHDAERAFKYGMGIGKVLRRHRYPFWFHAYGWFRSAGGASLALARLDFARARFYRNALSGKFLGWWHGSRV